MDEHERKTALFEQFARVGKALANPGRLELLDLLAQGERSVEELAKAARMKVSNTSAQLRMLAGAGLVTSRRDGMRIFYRLADSGVTAFIGQLQDFAASRLAEVEHAAREYLGDVTALEPVARGERPAGCATVRSWSWTCGPRPSTPPATSPAPSAFRTTSSPRGSPSSPPAPKSLPTAAAAIAYSPLTRFRLLRERGFSARPLEGGLPDWRLAGLPVAAGAAA